MVNRKQSVERSGVVFVLVASVLDLLSVFVVPLVFGMVVHTKAGIERFGDLMLWCEALPIGMRFVALGLLGADRVVWGSSLSLALVGIACAVLLPPGLDLRVVLPQVVFSFGSILSTVLVLRWTSARFRARGKTLLAASAWGLAVLLAVLAVLRNGAVLILDILVSGDAASTLDANFSVVGMLSYQGALVATLLLLLKLNETRTQAGDLFRKEHT